MSCFRKARDIHWAGGRTSAPPDTPICGFDGTGCPEKGPIPPWKIVTVAFCAILLIIAFIGFFVYRYAPILALVPRDIDY